MPPINPATLWQLLSTPVFYVRPQAVFETSGGKPEPWGYLRYYKVEEQTGPQPVPETPWVFADMSAKNPPQFKLYEATIVDGWFAAGRVNEYDHDPFV